MATFFNNGQTEQGIFALKTNFISNLSYLGRYRIRNFLNIDYTRGFDRYSDEYLILEVKMDFPDSEMTQQVMLRDFHLSLESVLSVLQIFMDSGLHFSDLLILAFLFGTNDFVGNGDILSAIGFGVRIRNDNLVLNTLQIRLGFFPNLPEYSRINHMTISGEQLLRPNNFDPGPPSLLPYK